MPLKIRVSKIDCSQEELVKHILSWTDTPDTAIIVQEQQPHIHYHAYIDNSITIPTVRKRLSQICPTKQNDSYSVSDKHSDWKGYKGYLFKYDDTVVLHSYYDEQELRDYYNSKVGENKKYTEFTAIYKYIMDNIEGDITPRNIASHLCDYYLKEGKIFHKAHQAQILRTIWYKLNNSRDQIITSILEEAELLQTEDCELLHLQMENKSLREHLKNYLRKTDPE